MIATPGHEYAQRLQIEPPAVSRAEVVRLDDDQSATREEPVSGASLCLDESPSLLYERAKPPVWKDRKVGLEKESCRRR